MLVCSQARTSSLIFTQLVVQCFRTPRGSVVSTYEELVEYLCTQPCIGPTGVQRHFLPFMGRNQVLFCTPSTPEAEA